ncbi:MAG: hypothetical protein H7Z21_05555 [Hymenobacter sp.]|nr:hypothetical protein [Hymenobacter sp.]
MPHPRRLVFSIAALAGTLLLHACSQAWPDSFTDSALAGAPAPTPAKRTTGTAADSLNGIPGHTFGEPLRNFPGLVLLEEDETGVAWYQVPAGQERGWFGKHAEQSINLYQFQDGRFSMFYAIATGLEGSPTAMRRKLLTLFGPGKDQRDPMGRVDWEGERVRVMYSENLMPPGTCWLEVHSKPLLAVQQARQRAQVQVNDAKRKL